MLNKSKRFSIVFLALLSFSNQAFSLNLIRDAEIEESLSSITRSISKHSQLHGDLSVYIVDDNKINAFTPGGNQIFINTGMILKCKSYDMIAAVIAHEIGHMQSGHKISRRMNIENAQMLGAMGMLLSLGSIVATGASEGVFVGTLSGAEAMQRSVLKFSRDQEIAADVAGAQLLDKANLGYKGAIKVLESLKRYDKVMKDEYLSTHPFASERIKLYKGKQSEGALDETLAFAYKMARSKTEAYTLPNKGVNELPLLKSNSPEDIYEKAIIEYRNYRYADSLKNIEHLLKVKSNYAYFHELKGMILFDSGKWLDGIAAMDRAIDLSKNPDLLKIQKALYLLSVYDKNRDKNNLNKAEKALLSINNENDIYYKHHLLARVYGKLGKSTSVEYHLAEMNFAIGNKERAKLHAQKALKFKDLLSKYQKTRLKDFVE
ncbi:MAG: M48 family metalloprotease [Alphaproteobacteria bacterium]|nr:M48 family metalloprotease [Alphaproteobacteria bacterium]OJV12147.1 MAG: hypothetical protein BGO27_05355 [Alphaproteobacteria bacterium 33-17]